MRRMADMGWDRRREWMAAMAMAQGQVRAIDVLEVQAPGCQGDAGWIELEQIAGAGQELCMA